MASESEKAPQGEKHVVAVIPLYAIGHLQMFLPIVKELLDRGTEVHMFLDKMGEDNQIEKTVESLVELGLIRHPLLSMICEENLDVKDIYEKKYLPLLQSENLDTNPQMLWVLGLQYMCYDLIPITVEKFKEIKPNSILFDTFYMFAHAAGKILDIPTIGYVSYPGPGCLDMEDALLELGKNEAIVELKKKLAKPILDNFNFDVHAEFYGSPGPVFYSDYINVVTTIEELAQTESKIHEKRLHTFKYIGPAIDENLRLNATVTPKAKDEKDEISKDEDKAPVNSFLDVTGDIPWKAVTDAKLSGKQIVCLSFGTVLTSFKWNREPSSESNQESTQPGSMGGAYSGKELCQRLWKDLFEAFREDPDVLFVVAIGKQEDALEGEGLQVPSNFIIRQQIPQLKVLQNSDVFITHGGWNSLQESLQCGVPILVLPGFGDQPRNARKANETGIGIGIEEPYLNAPVDVLKSSLKALLHEERYKATAEALGKKLTESNGPKQAADLILSSIKT